MPTKLKFSLISHVDMTKRPSGNEPELPSAGARRAKRGGGGGGVVAKRGRGRRAELVPVLERLRPRQLRGVRGWRVSERGRTKSPSSKKPETIPISISRPIISVKALSSLKQEEAARAEKEEGSMNKPHEGICISAETVACDDTDSIFKEATVVGIEKQREDGEGTSSTAGVGEQESVSVPLLPPVPKLRRSHATGVSLENVLHERPVHMPLPSSVPRDSRTSSHLDSHADQGVSLMQTEEWMGNRSVDAAHTTSIQTRRIQRKRGRPAKKVHVGHDASSVVPDTLSSNPATECTPTYDDTDNALLVGPFPKELCSRTLAENRLTTSADSSVVETLTNTFSLEKSDTSSSENPNDAITDEGEDLEYPQPSTNYQKRQRQLARQKQLDDMRAREMAAAREERLLRRRGFTKSPEKGVGNGGRRIRWREQTDLVEVFIYSPCSSRGSTLEPDETPGFM